MLKTFNFTSLQTEQFVKNLHKSNNFQVHQAILGNT